MSVDKIEQLENVLKLDKGTKIIEQKITRLTAPGENYGSVMLKLDIKVQDPNGTVKEVNYVAKTVPPNEFIQRHFNTKVTFKNEIGFYKSIVPTLQDFQRERGFTKVINCFPQCSGARLNLNEEASDEVDENGVILMENLALQNYRNLERTVGFDLETSKLLLNDLAQLHAVTIALKLEKPQIFEDKVKKYLVPYVFLHEPATNALFTERILSNIGDIEECREFKNRVEKALTLNDLSPKPREPFATISHNDFWVNNTMIKTENGKSVDNKMVDFQVYDYASPARDLLFLIFSSVQNSVLENQFDDLVKYYYDRFASVLKQCNVDLKRFSFEALLKEIEEEIRESQILHCLAMTFPIFAPKGAVVDVEKLSLKDMVQETATQAQKEKLIVILNIFAQKKWI